jgi:hypothetical protein
LWFKEKPELVKQVKLLNNEIKELKEESASKVIQ